MAPNLSHSSTKDLTVEDLASTIRTVVTARVALE